MRLGMRALLVVVTIVLGLSCSAIAVAQGVPVEPGSAPAAAFPAAQTCTCHAERQHEWAGSMHSKALDDPVFVAKVAQGDAATGGKLGAFCKKCHGPVATISGEIGGTLTGGSADSIGCMFCHQAVGNAGEPGNVSQLLVPDGTRRAQLQNPKAPHPAVFSAFQTSAELCGGCHNVNHPANGTHLESTYAEWAASPYAKNGTVCQDCHMSEKGGAVGPFSGQAAATGPRRDNIYRMSFVGANVAQGTAEDSVALLKSAATVKIDSPDVVSAGQAASVTVTVTNGGAGHYLPTGLTEVRQMWLAVYAEDASGKRTQLGETRFGTVLKDAQGKFPAEMWEATGVQSDVRIPPHGSVTTSYTLEMPKDARQAKVVAALYYKSMDDELAKKANVENPTTEMAGDSAVVYPSQDAKNAAGSGGGSGGATLAGNLLPMGMTLALIVVVGGALFVNNKRKQ